jgi:hypothetical protein
MRDHHLEHERIGPLGEAVADAELDAVRLAIVIDDGKARLILPAQRINAADLAIVGVMLEGKRPERREIVGDALRRREIEPVHAVEPGIDDRIDDEVPGALMRAEDRPDLAGVARLFPMSGVEAELEIDAVEPRAVWRAARRKGPQLAAVEFEASLIGEPVERQIGALALKPQRHRPAVMCHRHHADEDPRQVALIIGERQHQPVPGCGIDRSRRSVHGEKRLATRDDGAQRGEPELADIGACLERRSELARHVEIGDRRDDAAENAVAEIAPAFDGVEQMDVAQRRPHLDGIDLAIGRHLLRAAQIRPIAQQETERLRREHIDHRLPMERGSPRAALGESRAHIVDVAGGDLRRPALDALPVDGGRRGFGHVRRRSAA